MRILLIIFFCLFIIKQGSSQTVDRIKTYVKAIDSLTRTRLVLNISEGSIKGIKKRGLKGGGFSRTTVTSPGSDTVYLIQQHDNIHKNLIQSYYFKSDTLIFCRIRVQDDNDLNETLFLQEKYYNNDKVILSIVSKNKLKKKYKWRIDFNHLSNGYYYLAEFKNKERTN